MLKLEKTEVFGWESTIRGMRNPLNSWDKSDSYWIYGTGKPMYHIGDNDLVLMKRLSKAGDDHAKFLRMINVTLDIIAPLYWWKEFDTYKVGTVANSCSTMHKIHDKEFTIDDFSHEHLMASYHCTLLKIIDDLNDARDKFIECTVSKYATSTECAEAKKRYWWQMIQLLPTSYNQRRTVQLNYQVLKSMYFARKNHKLDEWREFCAWIEQLPYFKEICIDVCEV